MHFVCILYAFDSPEGNQILVKAKQNKVNIERASLVQQRIQIQVLWPLRSVPLPMGAFQ
jgi:hypothetical protein